MIAPYLIPCMVSLFGGILYGLSFVLQQRSMLFTERPQLNRLHQMGHFLLRLVIIIFTLRYLLRLNLSASILGLTLFVGMFWLVILLVKAHMYEQI